MLARVDFGLKWTVSLLLLGALLAAGVIAASGGVCHSANGPSTLATVNACLNLASGVALVSGFVCIVRGNTGAHRVSMTLALALSALFLGTYIAYHLKVGHVAYVGQGMARKLYFAILIPHIVLAAAALPMILLTTYNALRGRFTEHRKWAKRTLPIWLFVSLSGVLVYVQLYGW